MDLYERRRWNENHKKLTNIVLKPEWHQAAVELFREHHGVLHASGVQGQGQATLEEVLFRDLRESDFRSYPVPMADTANSIAWHVWHITRIEDMTVNVLMLGEAQCYHSGEWGRKLGCSVPHSGNEMTADEIARLSAELNMEALLAYRKEVGRKTQHAVAALKPGDFRKRVDSSRLERLRWQGAVKPEALWLLDYWGKKTVAGLLLMPASRHLFLHLNKALRIKHKLQKAGGHEDERT